MTSTRADSDLAARAPSPAPPGYLIPTWPRTDSSIFGES
jgi:hypothetical protein